LPLPSCRQMERRISKEVENAIRSAPHHPGVYLFRGEGDRVLYVGKANSLRNRLRSYLAVERLTPRMAYMVGVAEAVETILVPDELNALILESNLIKRHRPPFNVLLKDDKHYPYLRIDPKEAFPRLELVRRVKADGARYYGPFVPTWAVRETMALLAKVFPLRQCKGELVVGKRERPCLNHQMKRCLAPCCSLVSQEEYRRLVEGVQWVLSGKGDSILKGMREEMEKAAEELRFEDAARLRDRVLALSRVMERQRVLLQREVDWDVVGAAQHGDRLLLHLLVVRGGMLIGEKSFPFRGVDLVEAHLSFLSQRYALDHEPLPSEVILGLDLPESELGLYARWFSERRGGAVKITFPKRGEKASLVSMARERAAEELVRQAEEEQARLRILEEARGVLGLRTLPERIEGYDISISAGRDPVGSMVLFLNGEPRKEGYRRFAIRTVEGADDYAMMREVLTRRFSNEDLPLPDLVLLDGGPGHLQVGLSVLEEAGLQGRVGLLALAKDRVMHQNEKVHLPGRREPLVLDPSSPVLQLLQRVRDEAHRFAVSYHRVKRGKRVKESALDHLPGVGGVRKRRLLEAFSSVEGILKASPQEIAERVGLSEKQAVAIQEALIRESVKREA